MSDRRVRAAFRALQGKYRGAKSAKSVGVLEASVVSILKNEPITEQTAESLREFFTTQCGPFLDPPTNAPEFLVMVGELITYIVDIKLENAASVTPARDGRADQFTLWSTVLDRGIVSCLQNYQYLDSYDPKTMGPMIIPALAKAWKSPVRDRFHLPLRIAIIWLLADSMKKCPQNAHVFLKSEVFGTTQLSLALANTFDGLLMEPLMELAQNAVRASHSTSQKDARMSLWKGIFETTAIKKAIGASNAKSMTATASDDTTKTVTKMLTKMMEMMSRDEARPQLFQAMNIRFADRTFEAVKNQPSLFVDHNGLTLNTVDSEGQTESITADYSIISRIVLATRGLFTRAEFHLLEPASLLFSPMEAEDTDPMVLVFEIARETEPALREALTYREQASKINATKSTKLPRSSKTQPIRLYPRGSSVTDPDSPRRSSGINVQLKRDEMARITEVDLTSSGPSPETLGINPQDTLLIPDMPAAGARESIDMDIDVGGNPDIQPSQKDLHAKIFDWRSDSELSEAPTPRRMDSLPRVPSSRASEKHASVAPTVLTKAKGSKKRANEVIEEVADTGKASKRRRTEQPAVVLDSPSPSLSDAAPSPPKPKSKPQPRAGAAATKKKKMYGRRAAPSNAGGDDDDYDAIPIRDDSPVEVHASTKPAKKSLRPRTRQSAASGKTSTLNIEDTKKVDQPADDDDEGDEQAPPPKVKRSAAKPKPLSKRILSDLEPSLAQTQTPKPPSSKSGRILSDLEPSLVQSRARARREEQIMRSEEVEAAQVMPSAPEGVLDDHYEPSDEEMQMQVEVEEVPAVNLGTPKPSSSLGVPSSPSKPKSKALKSKIAPWKSGNVSKVPDAVAEALETSIVSPSAGDRTLVQQDDITLVGKGAGERASAASHSTARLKKAAVDANPAAPPMDIPEFMTSSPTPGSQVDRRNAMLQTLPPVSKAAGRGSSAHAHPRSAPQVVDPVKSAELAHVSATPARPQAVISSPILTSALKSKSLPDSALRSRHSVSFLVEDGRAPVELLPKSSRSAPKPAAAKPPRPQIILPPAPVAKAKPFKAIPKADNDAAWADQVLNVLGEISESIVQAKRNDFKGIRHEVLASRNEILTNIQIELRRQVETYIDHYNSFVTLNHNFEAFGKDTSKAFSAFSSENSVIATKLQAVSREHSKTTLSKAMATTRSPFTATLLGSKTMGKTFAACGVGLSE